MPVGGRGSMARETCRLHDLVVFCTCRLLIYFTLLGMSQLGASNRAMLIPDTSLRDVGDVYEYVCTHVEDLVVAMKDPKSYGLWMHCSQLNATKRAQRYGPTQVQSGC